MPFVWFIYLFLYAGTPTTCGHPAIPMNARVTLSSKSLVPGTTATYICDEGYETFGNTVTSCTSNGQWSGELPFCGQ